MWITYGKRDINLSGLLEISREKSKKIVLTYMTGKEVELNYKSNSDRDHAYNLIHKDFLRHTIKV